MQLTSLVRRNLIWYWRTNLAVIAGVAVAVAVLAGALLVGASVRSSLRALALERLGGVDHVVTSLGFVREALADDLLAADGMAGAFEASAPLVAVEGFVTHQSSRSRASAVQVYGVDERFWTFHGRDPEQFDLARNAVFVSEGLARELGAAPDDALLVRVERPSEVPLSSLHGRRDDVGRTLRLGIGRVLPPEELGEFSFRPQQGLARSVFVPLARLQAELEQDGRVNTLLLRASAAADDVAAATQGAGGEAAVRGQGALVGVGLRGRGITAQGALSVESAAGLLDAETESAAGRAAATLGLATEPVLTYLANQIRSGERVTPYSLISALDLSVISPEAGPRAAPTGGPIPVVLNDWTAADLEVGPGDPLVLEYYLWEDEGRLVTREADLMVADVVPIAGAADDRDLAPEYRGMTDAEDVIDWDPPFDVDLSLIRPADEDYWDDHRTTPKAFVPLAAGQQLWESRWGRLTSIRVAPAAGEDLDSAAAQFAAALRADLDPLALGFVVYPARALAIEASAGATDFGLYFIYFSFFLVVSALLLASLFFRLGVEQRLRELGLLRAAGFPGSAVRRVFLTEALALSAVGSVLGAAGAVAYAWFIMWGLRTWWVDAVGTTRLALDVSPLMLGAGAAGGVLAALGSIGWTLRSLAPASPRSLLTGAVAEVTAAGVAPPGPPPAGPPGGRAPPGAAAPRRGASERA
ncbi:MAG: FtsX-like permease family protein, partial [Acidobacteria bacterium]|nr:FtsX-like permease family protein [Acidobacteriota bacterium]